MTDVRPEKLSDDLAKAIGARFWAKVNKQGPIPKHRPELGACWIWLGSSAAGYGQFFLGGKLVKSHRIAFALDGKSRPESLELDHLCRNKSCVNPGHLEAVTHQENILRGVKKTHCKRGHLLIKGNLYIRPSAKPTHRGVCVSCIRILAKGRRRKVIA